jgi:hypothetical protein
VQPHAEHQQHDADLRELQRHLLIADEPGRVRPQHDPRQQISDNRREPELFGNQTENKCGEQTDREIDQEFVVHRSCCGRQYRRAGGGEGR